MRFFILLTLLILPTFIYPQNISEDIFKLDTTIFTDNKVDCMSQNFVLSLYKDTIYCINNSQKVKNNTLNIIGFSTLNNSYFSMNIYFEKENKYLTNLSRFPIYSFWFKDDYLALTTTNGIIFKFIRDNQNVFQYSKTITLDCDFKKAIPLSNNKILLYTSSFNSNNNIYLYDFEKEKIISKKELESPIPILSIFLPRDIICTDSNHIYYSPANEYIIRIYDNNFNIVDSIIYNKKNWDSFPKSKMEKILEKTNQPSDIIYALSDDVDNTYSSIMRLFAINEHLIVMYRISENGKTLYLYDIWGKNNNKWELIKEAVNDYKQGDIGKNQLFPFSIFLFHKNEIFRFAQKVPIKKENYKTEKEYIKAYEEYQIDNDCLLGVEKLKIKL